MKKTEKVEYESPNSQVVMLKMCTTILETSQQDYRYGGMDEEDD